MSIGACMQKTKIKFEKGLISKPDVSFKCFRKNELMILNKMPHGLAWEKAINDWNCNHKKYFSD